MKRVRRYRISVINGRYHYPSLDQQAHAEVISGQQDVHEWDH